MATNGIDWKALLEMAAPVVGGLVAKGAPAQTGFQQGWLTGTHMAQQDKEQKAQEAQRLQAAGQNYALKGLDYLNGLNDPVEFNNALDVLKKYAPKGADATAFDNVTFPQNKLAAAKLKELTDQIAAADKNGYNVDDLAQSGAVFQLKDGSHIPVSTAVDLVGGRPQDTSGGAIPRPKKQDVNAPTDYSRSLARYAKGLGKSVDDLTWKEEQDFEKQRTDAGRVPAQSKTDGAGPDAQLSDLMILSSPTSTPSEKADAQKRVTLRKQANQVNDRPATDMATSDRLTPDAVEYAATQYRILGPSGIPTRLDGNERVRIVNAASNQTKSLGQTPAMAVQKQAAFKSDGAALTQMRRMSSAAQAFETKALAQTDLVSGLSTKVPRTQYPVINDGLLTFKDRVLGDQNTQLLFNALTTFTTEYAKVMQGSTGASGADVSARADAAKLISAGLNNGTLQKTIDQMKWEMRQTMNGYDATINAITERMGGSAPSPETAPATTPQAGPAPLSYQDYLKAKGGR